MENLIPIEILIRNEPGYFSEKWFFSPVMTPLIKRADFPRGINRNHSTATNDQLICFTLVRDFDCFLGNWERKRGCLIGFQLSRIRVPTVETYSSIVAIHLAFDFFQVA